MAEKTVQESRAVPRGKVSPMKSLTPRKARGRFNEHGGKAKSTRGDLGKRVSVDGFRGDPMFPRIERVVADLLAKGNVVTPVDVLIGMGLLLLVWAAVFFTFARNPPSVARPAGVSAMLRVLQQ